ncbi:MAG: hypothetical protein ABI743_04925 [bacterium]
MANTNFPKPPVDPREVTGLDLRYAFYYFVFAFCVYIIASFGLISEV